jgi:hypothetical protein
MSKPIHYRARFADGEVVTRTTSSAKVSYTHAYKVTGKIKTRDGLQPSSGFVGFASSRQEAQKRGTTELHRYVDGKCEIVRVTIVPADQIAREMAAKPWRIIRRFPNGREVYVEERGGKHARFRTAEDATAEIATLRTLLTMKGSTFRPIKGETASTPAARKGLVRGRYRIKRSNPDATRYVMERGAQQRRFMTVADAQAYIREHCQEMIAAGEVLTVVEG